MATSALIACHECDLLQRVAPVRSIGKAYCWRCGALLFRRTHDSLDRTLAFTLAAAIFMIVANSSQIAVVDVQGDHTSTTLYGSVRALYNDDMRSVAALVFTTTILMPALDIVAMLYMLVPLKLGKIPAGLPGMFRLIHAVKPWGMVEVFMLGTLVSLAKLGHLAHVLPGIALWSFGALMFLLAEAAASFDAEELWARVEAITPQRQYAGPDVLVSRQDTRR
jgi:paraquat-inducible protein A